MSAEELRQVIDPLIWAVVCAGALSFLGLLVSVGVLVVLLRDRRGLVEDSQRVAEFALDALDGNPRAELGENVRYAAESIERRFPVRW